MNRFQRWLLAESRESMRIAEAGKLGDIGPMAIMPPDPCPGCGCEHFADGGGVVNGRRGTIVNASRVVRCLNCGEDWFGTPQGWRKPHESALPPAWSAMRAAERHHREQQELLRERNRTRDDAGTPSRRRAPNEGFRRPPVSDET